MTNLRKLIALPLAERRLLIEAALLVASTRLGLWTLPLRTVYHLLALLPPGSYQAGSLPPISWAVSIASVYVPHATCLPQALVAQALLRRYGLPGILRVGVARSPDGAFEAHAWVEREGQIVVGGPAESLARFAVLPSVEQLLGGRMLS